METLWFQLGGIGAFLALCTYVVQASIRGTWNSKSQVDRLLAGKDELIALKDAQIALLVVQTDKKDTTISELVSQNGALVEGSKILNHFFSEVRVVPSKGDTINETGT